MNGILKYWQTVMNMLGSHSFQGVLFLVFLTTPDLMLTAAERIIRPTDDLRRVFRSADPGDVFVLQDGLWTDKIIEIEAYGTAEEPVQLKAQSPGNVLLTGGSGVKISGEHVVVSGLRFQNVTGLREIVQFRTSSKSLAQHCRLTNCVIEDDPKSGNQTEGKWVSLYGQHNRVDHCRFEGKKSLGALLVVWVGEGDNRHLIDHNHFGERPPLGRNGGETIRVGTSGVSLKASRTIVEHNLFVKCDGEAEIISSKTCRNIYRHNTFRECSGALTLRHGNDCRVESNMFLGNKARGTGGVRIIGSGHVVVNNYFADLEGDDSRSGISFMNGFVDSPLSGYFQVEKAVVAFNTFVDCKVAMTIGVGASPEQPLAPTDCTVLNNVFAGRRNEIRVHAEPIKWVDGHDIRAKSSEELNFLPDAHGICRPTGSSPVVGAVTLGLDLVRDDIDGEKRTPPFDAGCDQIGPQSSSPLTADAVGPNWTGT